MQTPLLSRAMPGLVAALALLASLACPAPRTEAQTAGALRLNVINSRREVFGELRGSGEWVAYTVDEDETDLNKDGDTDDTIMAVLNMRTMAVQEIPLALDTTLEDETEDPLVALSPKGDYVAVQVSESEQGAKDLNGNNKATDNVVALYNLANKQLTNLQMSGRSLAFAGGSLFFLQFEATAGKDLNGDGDATDTVLTSYSLASHEFTNLKIAGSRLLTAGDWVAVLADEGAQGGTDLNGDGDAADSVVQLFRASNGQGVNTHLDGSGGIVLTPNLLAVGVSEEKQGRKDLNEDGDLLDTVCAVWNLADGSVFNTRQDCTEGLAGDGTLVGMVTSESGQGAKDLNSDGDTDDSVAQCYTLSAAKAVNIARDATGGLTVNAGKVAFSCSEEDNGKRDLNADGDTEDFVLLVYDPNRGPTGTVTNTKWSADGDVAAGDGYLAWKVLESDQGNRDRNRDGDTDDSILAAMDLRTGATTVSTLAVSDSLFVSASGIAFSTFESDQGERDLNMDGDAEDEILQIARFVK